MGFFDRLFGTNTDDTTPQRQAPPAQGQQPQRSDDEIAVERYRYLLRTAPPETIEGVHREAFSKLTPEQRELLFTELSKNAPQGDAPRSSDAAALATSATRSELRQPGTMERSMGGGGGMGFGSMVASSLLGTVAGYVIGSALVSAFLPTDTGSTDASGEDAAADDTASADSADASADGGGDFGGGDFGGGDFGGGFDF
jgi:hypothetical protein